MKEMKKIILNEIINKIKINKMRSKQIGKFYRISLVPYTNNTAIIYIYELKDMKYIKHKIGKYENTKVNQHALSIYNETKTVKDIKHLLNIEKPYQHN